MAPEVMNVILLFLGAIVAAVLFIADRTNRRLETAIPSDVLPLFLGLLALAETLAKQTPTTADDELIERIKQALVVPPPEEPVEEPTAPQTAEELAARLNGNGAVG